MTQEPTQLTLPMSGLFTLRIFKAPDVLLHEQRFELRRNLLHPLEAEMQHIYRSPMVMLLEEFKVYFQHNCNFSRVEVVPAEDSTQGPAGPNPLDTEEEEVFIGITRSMGLLNIRHMDKSKPAFRVQSQRVDLNGMQCYCLRLMSEDLPFVVRRIRPTESTERELAETLRVFRIASERIHELSKLSGQPCPCGVCKSTTTAPESEDVQPLPWPEVKPSSTNKRASTEPVKSQKRVRTEEEQAHASPERESIAFDPESPAVRRMQMNRGDPYRWVSMCMTVLPWSPFCLSVPVFGAEGVLVGFALPLQWFNHVFTQLSTRTTRITTKEVELMFDSQFICSKAVADRFRAIFPKKFRPQGGQANVILFRQSHINMLQHWYNTHREECVVPFLTVDQLDPVVLSYSTGADKLFDQFLRSAVVRRRCRIPAVMSWAEMQDHFKREMSAKTSLVSLNANTEIQRMHAFVDLVPKHLLPKSAEYRIPPLNIYPSDIFAPIQTTLLPNGHDHMRAMASSGLMELSLQRIVSSCRR